MAYLHCHGCGWSQDDFWSLDGYNPLSEYSMAELRCDLFKDKIKLDQGTMTGREFVVMELKQVIARIETMKVMTDEEWQEVKYLWACPECKSNDWDID